MPDELYDLDLTRGDIGQLENREALIAFFARLGYNVDDAAKTSLSALGLDSAEWQHQVREAYRLAVDPEDEDIVVYLFEVRSVTKALIDAIGRSFGSREESPLLVLTHDYEQLDFVLVQRKKRVPGRDGVIRYGVETRGIKVERRNASTVHLRVLKRLTFTEADALLQWDKLVAAFIYAATASEFFNNRALFSDYYLTHRLTDGQLTSEWREEDQARYMARTARRLLVNARARLANKTRSAIWQELYAPLFKELRLWPERQAARDATAGAGQPDYLVFDPDDRSAVLAAALVYPWERNLDNTDPVRDPERGDEIPGARVVSVLASASVSWAIVTNGKVWRLYAANADNRATNYYEIDLDEGLASIDQLTATKYWWLFFRREAFTGFLDRMLRESAEYAKGLRERLKNRVFEEVFARFAEGFILHGRARGAEPPLDETFTGTMTFLYRLMFILYAESLGLLPASEERGYGEKSMARLKQEIASAGGDVEDESPARLAVAYSPDSTALYERLAGLCAAIDQGDADLNLPRYNGGLFSATTAAGQFLARHAIPDRQLALGLDRLCRDQDDKTFDLVMVDYKTLGVRELGSIYEGLLEFKLRIADEKMAVVREGGKEVYLPLARAKGKRAVQTLGPGDVYLENDKRERKASGSYYTPDYIVKYIVRHTVGPVLERKFEALRPRLEAAQRKYGNHKKKVIANGNLQPPELFWKNDDMARLADDCLDIKVLDPAMGSGHFLVEAVDFVSNQLIDFLNGWSENPVWGLLARTQEDILADMVRQRVTIESARLTRVSLLKRAVLQRCIYGVDLNEMAVELAKLSLWLDAFTLGAPLSFLDHHLKHGNSLIGVQKVEDYILPNTGRWGELLRALSYMVSISKTVDATHAEVTLSQELYRQAQEALRPFKERLNVELAPAFDASLQPVAQAAQYAYLDVDGKASAPPETIRKFDRAQTIAQERCFFHWKVEFPEVFVDMERQDWRADGGFDSVVGNPPYIPTEQLDGETRRFLPDSFAVERKYETSAPFVEQSLRALGWGGLIGMITPIMWQTGENYTTFRERMFSRQYQPTLVVNLPFDVFPDAYIDTGIQIIARSEGSATVFRCLSYEKYESIAQIDENHKSWNWVPVQFLREEPGLKLYMDTRQYDIRRKLRADDRFTNLVAVTESCQGIVESFYAYSSAQSPRFPMEYRNLEAYRYDWNTLSRSYISMQPDDSLARFYRRPRLLIRRIVSRSDRLMAIAVEESFVVRKDLNPFVPRQGSRLSIYFLLALLNSRLLSWAYTGGSAASLRDDFRQTTLGELNTLPIRLIRFASEVGSGTALPVMDWRSAFETLKDTSRRVLESTVGDEDELAHDLLVRLAQLMLELNTQRAAATKRFLGWLESRIRIKPDKDGAIGIDSLAGKSIFQNYLGDYQKGEREQTWDKFYDRLFQNRRRFGVPLEDVRGEIEAEYEKSLAVLLPIKEQLEATDNLIDKIVYRLYGLTEEEIAIIEGPAFQQAQADAKAAVAGDKELQADPDRAMAEMADRVRAAGERVINQLSLAEERKVLDEALPGWNLYPDDVARALLTGEYSIRSMPDGLDFSGTVMEYSKAVEAAVYHRIFLRFRAESGCTAADVGNEVFQKFMHGKTALTLGNFNFILPPSKEPALAAFVRRIYGRADEVIYGKAGVLKLLSDQANIDLRNAAAHDRVLDREAAKAVRAWAFAVLRNL